MRRPHPRLAADGGGPPGPLGWLVLLHKVPLSPASHLIIDAADLQMTQCEQLTLVFLVRLPCWLGFVAGDFVRRFLVTVGVAEDGYGVRFRPLLVCVSSWTFPAMEMSQGGAGNADCCRHDKSDPEVYLEQCCSGNGPCQHQEHYSGAAARVALGFP